MLDIDAPWSSTLRDLLIVEKSASRRTNSGRRRLGGHFSNLKRMIQERGQEEKGASMSHNSHRRMLFRAEAPSGPKFSLAYHKVIPGVGSRLYNIRWETKSISRADTAYSDILYRRRHTETGPPLSAT